MFAYVPSGPHAGTGHAVVTDRFVCLLGEENAPSVAVELYRLLELPATTIADVLDVFMLHGSAKRFAIVEVIDPVERIVRVAVSGELSVDLAGAASTRLEGPTGATSWSGEVRGVQTLRLTIGTPEAGDLQLPIRRGVVRTRDIAIDAAAEAAPELPIVEDLQTRTIELPHLAEVEVEAAAEPSPVVVEQRSAPAEPRRVDLARLSSRIFVLHLPDGSQLEPSTPVVVGRRPWRTTPDETTTFYVVAPSPNREISGIHLEVALIDGELRARDLDSTNGTIVLTPTRAPRLLHEGRSTALEVGDILDLGEDFRIAVATRTT
ncbi:MAG: FHA domain-containing protein [Pseudolysinimonas sp.]|uniref:FHA domain-containing protein n=1 Tax=Pseudolysinimonas sp. TaxID=2680009 RepID=UPI0032668D82